MRYLMLFQIVLFYFVLASYSFAENKSSEFALTFNCGDDKKFKLCLIGTYPLQKATLLSEKDSSICVTKTKKAFDYCCDRYDEKIAATFVETKNCKNLRKFSIAYIGENVTEFENLDAIQNNEQLEINKIDSLIRKKNLLEASEKYFREYMSKKPVLYKPTPQKDVYIAQYLVTPASPTRSNYGPLFFYANGKVEELDEEAYIASFFKINNRFFIFLHHGCWGGCGNIGTYIWEIKEAKLKRILVDGTWAD